jgi:hypothetical protein
MICSQTLPEPKNKFHSRIAHLFTFADPENNQHPWRILSPINAIVINSSRRQLGLIISLSHGQNTYRKKILKHIFGSLIQYLPGDFCAGILNSHRNRGYCEHTII